MQQAARYSVVTRHNGVQEVITGCCSSVPIHKVHAIHDSCIVLICKQMGCFLQDDLITGTLKCGSQVPRQMEKGSIQSISGCTTTNVDLVYGLLCMLLRLKLKSMHQTHKFSVWMVCCNVHKMQQNAYLNITNIHYKETCFPCTFMSRHYAWNSSI